MVIQFEKLNPYFGAAIRGLDLAGGVSRKIFTLIRQAFIEYGVLVFQGQNLSIPNQVSLGRKFGEVQIHVMDQYHIDSHPEVYFLTNLNCDGQPSGNHPDQGTLHWHTDGSWRKRTGQATIMVADVVPENGGETSFCCMEAGYQALETEIKKRILNLKVVHNLDYSRNRRHGHLPLSEKQKNKVPPVTHPMIRKHPESGRVSLFLGDHAEYIEGMEYNEGRKLIDELNSCVIRFELVYTHKYKHGDVVIWDNRRMLHKATPYDVRREKRVMRRTTILGDEPRY